MKHKKVKYEIITSSSASELQGQVNNYITNGWKPKGGVSTSGATNSSGGGSPHWAVTYCQAVVRELK